MGTFEHLVLALQACEELMEEAWDADEAARFGELYSLRHDLARQADELVFLDAPVPR